MQISKSGPDFTGSWTIAWQSERFREFVPGTLYPKFGLALLWYKPERRLSISIWSRWLNGAHNLRLLGPAKLSWERS